jgi:3-phenylpropionate/trans-cinnamate dioxygenase ferredoxin component
MTMAELATAGFRVVGPSSALRDGEVTPFYLADDKLRISVTRIGAQLHAFSDLCTCPGAPCPLSGGLLEAGTLMCQCHGSRFDIATGAVVGGPATQPLRIYEVQDADGEIRIRA